ncbi:hypothetical protein OBBRIDRAFT_83102 [Obba rivulosa]|uniref:Protein-S-isoprenylcysteine O-methyltransferase n=1 Tax=Obba rivulosa TaxID=1052685 RepID=A0A8E2DMV6_9APHY|nr:hypothetical protein OBBRIDRAFT_83102 [Obba rivulosa]
MSISHRIGISLISLCELTVICALHFPGPASGRILFLVTSPSGVLPDTRISIAFILGWILTVTGALVRVGCYHALGRDITLQSATHERQNVVTRRLYALVRHIAYATALSWEDTGGTRIGLVAAGGWAVGFAGSAVVWQGLDRAPRVGWLYTCVEDETGRRGLEKDGMSGRRGRLTDSSDQLHV